VAPDKSRVQMILTRTSKNTGMQKTRFVPEDASRQSFVFEVHGKSLYAFSPRGRASVEIACGRRQDGSSKCSNCRLNAAWVVHQ